MIGNPKGTLQKLGRLHGLYLGDNIDPTGRFSGQYYGHVVCGDYSGKQFLYSNN